MRPLKFAIALGVKSGGTEGTSPHQFKSLEGTSPRYLGTFIFFKTEKNVLNGILSNYVDEMGEENYIWARRWFRAYHIAPQPPSPT